MTTKLRLILLLILGISTIASAKKKEEPAPIVGLVYNLPRTVVKINVEAQYTQLVAGPYAKYADKYLGIKNVVLEDVLHWSMSNISFNTFTEADPSQQYQSMGVGGSLVSLCSNGVIAGVNTIAPTQSTGLNYSSFIAPTVQKPLTNFTTLTMEGRTYTVSDSTGVRTFKKTDEEMAQEAANTIIDLRQQRYDLLAGALDSSELGDAQTLQAAADKLHKMELEYLSLFIGASYSASCNFSFDYVPTTTDKSGDVAFRFSEEHGPVPVSDLSGAPVIISIQTNALGEGFGNAESEHALYYRIPGKATFTLEYADKTLATAQIEIAQFGTIMPIPNQLLDGKFEIKMNPETGAIMGSKQVVFEVETGKKKK
ncbi:MAG: DUF4831 family protein [Mangrovibacterium sp.]